MNLFIIILILCSWVDALRILSVFPLAAKSHYLAGRPIMQELLKRGHEVVSISPYEEESRENFTWIQVEVKSLFEADPKLRQEIGQNYSFFGYLNYIWRTMNIYVTYITKKPKLAEFMRNDTSHFDLIFAHDFFQPIFYTFAHKYKAPLVTMSSYGYTHYIQNYMGGHFDCVYPHELSNLQYPLNFLDVIRNCIYVAYDISGRKIQLYRYQNTLVPELFGIQGLDLENMERNIELVLLNSYYTAIPKANLPNIVDIGGLHIEKPKPLVQDLQNILDGADHGAILLSLGAIIELEPQQAALITAVVSTLASLKQRVIVYWSSKVDLTAYNNIYPYQWQDDILAHPKIKLFINHGGGINSDRAIFHGVPIICIPFHGNQHQVCEASVKLGFAIRIQKDQLGNSLNDSIQKILSDGSYKKNVLEASRSFKDRPDTALNTAVFWIEFCARNKHIFTKNGGKTKFVIVLLLPIIVLLFYIVRKKGSLKKGYSKKSSSKVKKC